MAQLGTKTYVISYPNRDLGSRQSPAFHSHIKLDKSAGASAGQVAGVGGLFEERDNFIYNHVPQKVMQQGPNNSISVDHSRDARASSGNRCRYP